MPLPSPHRRLLWLSIQLYPDGDFSQEMELEGWARSFQPQTPEDQLASHNVASSSNDASPLPPSLGTSDSPVSRSRDSVESDSGMCANNEVLPSFRTLCISPPRYFGKSSGMSLVRSAMSAKPKASDGESPRKQPRPEFWNLPVSNRFVVVRISLIDLSRKLTVCGLPSENITSLNQNSSLA
jgi:hypothetical protein